MTSRDTRGDVALVLFGLMLALIHVGNIFGSELAHRVNSPNRVLLISLGTLIVSTAALIFASGSLAIILLLIICFFGSQAGTIVLDENLQHETKSELRATTLSLASLVGKVFFGVSTGVIIVFGTGPAMIAMTTLVAFMGIAIYLPARKRLASPVAIEEKVKTVPESSPL